MSDPTEGFTGAEAREFQATCDRWGFNPEDPYERRLAAGVVRDLPVRSWLTSREGKRARKARDAWLLLRVGDWHLYGWRLFAAVMAWSFLAGVGRGLARTWFG